MKDWPVVDAASGPDGDDSVASATAGVRPDSGRAGADLDQIEKTHQWDSHVPQEALDTFSHALERDEKQEIAKTEEILGDNSPYEEVRAAVRNTDDGEVANTVRAWILGMLFVTVGSGLNMFLSMRSPAINFPATIVQLLAYPIGCLWAKVVSRKEFNTFGVRWTFNTGPFTIKEHVVITIMANVSIGYAYSTDALLALQGKPFYNLNLGWGYAILFTLSSQLIGISLAGLFRRFLVWPAAMIWPGQFANTSLFYALHDKSKSDGVHSNGWLISRYRWFSLVTLAMFCYYWIPGVLFQALSAFAFVTWIRPKSVVVNQLFGGATGLSLIPITFDWTYVTAYLGDPLLAPTHSHVNVLIGLVVFVILTSIGIVYSGALYADYLPMVTSQTYDNMQKFYNVSRILGPGYTFDVQKYKEYSPLFLAPTLAVNYNLSFAALTAAIVHVSLYHGKEIWYRFRTARDQEPDVHMKMMQKYVEAPDWWYGALFLSTFALGLGCVLGYDSQLPWWTFIISIITALVFILPSSMILAVSNISLALNVLSPFLAGFIIPGRPIGNMMFHVFSSITLAQAQTYSGDLKLAHYMKLPPRVTFWCQVIPTIWATFVQIAVMNWALGNLEDVCEVTQTAHFTCPNGRAFFSSSIVWGVIGPRRMFGIGSIYAQLNWFWLVGATFPVILYFLHRVTKIGLFGYLHAPILLGAMAWLPPATPLSFWSWAIFGLIFNKFIRQRWNGWWQTYNYTTAAALDAGLILSTLVIFFAITLPNVEVPQWWGNVGAFKTLDQQNKAVLKTVQGGDTFGPATW
ncbi:Sexual differentiation process protein isp4 [Cladobotryum mycophilum]|uniref:Sexual differentiation process protein isp4 n=1 Tax=Cladobotryum mycophilum TaxID=491253 RepID=A0ABR0SXN1_9HYPO